MTKWKYYVGQPNMEVQKVCSKHTKELYGPWMPCDIIALGVVATAPAYKCIIEQKKYIAYEFQLRRQPPTNIDKEAEVFMTKLRDNIDKHFRRKQPAPIKVPEQTSADITKQTEEFLAQGGEITHLSSPYSSVTNGRSKAQVFGGITTKNIQRGQAFFKSKGKKDA